VLLAPVSAEEMRAATVLSAVTMAVLVGGGIFGRHAFAVRVAFAVLYIGALLAFIARHMFAG